MAINLSSGFNITKNEPIDTRILKSKAEMAALTAAQELRMPSVYMCICSDDHKVYVFDKTNTKTESTGKFRAIDNYLDFETTEAKEKIKPAIEEIIKTLPEEGKLILDGGEITLN